MHQYAQKCDRKVNDVVGAIGVCSKHLGAFFYRAVIKVRLVHQVVSEIVQRRDIMTENVL